ncbi:MAG: hydrogenase expression/formation protein HypE [Candidatus Hadarchaeales archaeon]
MSSEKITLEHGGGGTKMMKLIAETVLKEFSLKRAGLVGLDDLDDGATVDIGNHHLVFTTDAHTVKPIFFPGGDIGKLSVCGTVNDLAVMGARPLVMSSAVVVEEGFLVEDFRKICSSMATVCSEIGLPLITGDFKVMEKGALDRIVITTTGLGLAKEVKTDSMLRPGQKIILTGTVGDHGATLLAFRHGFDIGKELASDVAPLWETIEAAMQAGEVSAMKDPTRGGVAGALNEMASKSNVGIVVWEEAIPISEAVSALCETLGVDPYYIVNEGKALIGVSANDGNNILDAIHHTKYGKNAQIIGEVTKDYPGKVILETKNAGRRILQPPEGDPYPRIC